MTLTPQNYYDDKSHITNSMLSDFVSYEKWNRILTPETYYARHISKQLKFEPTDAMLCGTIADRYFSEWPHILDEYPVVSKRNGLNKNEITNSMNDKVVALIKTFEAFKTFQDFICHGDCKNGSHLDAIITKDIILPDWRVVPMKWKLDFVNDAAKCFIDQKTTANCNTYWNDIQFRWVPNIYHRNIRQMTLYSKLTDGYHPALAVADEEGRMLFIPIEQYIIDKCWTQILIDLEELMTYYDNNWTDMIKNPFAQFPTEEIKAESNEVF